MPGIVGIVSEAPAADCRRDVSRMIAAMLHEPFYKSGTCDDETLGVYAGWVVHPGSFANLQSGRHGDTLDLALAGECVQDEDLVSLYQQHGDEAIARLNGLFSGLIIDRVQRRALLFNDRYGVERVYLHETTDALYFASEAKAILSVMRGTRAFDDEGVAQFLALGCQLDDTTLFSGVKTLPGGSLWSFDGRVRRKARYFEPRQWESQSPLSPDEYDKEFQQRFGQAMPRYLSGKSQLGVSLTGGLDTRMILASSSTRARKPICYTFCGPDNDTLDARIAGRVAAACALEHRLLRVGADFLTDFPLHADRAVYVTDGSCGPLVAHEIYLNAQARHVAPIRLTGNFGSEVLRGVSTFKAQRLPSTLVVPEMHRAMQAAGERVATLTTSAVTLAAFKEIPWSLFGTMAAAKSQLVFRTPYLDNDLVALAYRVPAAMRQSPNAALRLINELHPPLSRMSTDRGVSLDGRGLRYFVKRLASEATFKFDYVHYEDLPRPLLAFDDAIGAIGRAGRVLGRHKYLAYRGWFRGALSGYVTDAVSAAATLGLPYWNPARLKTLARDHVAGTRNCLAELNAVITLTSAHQQLLRQNATLVRPGYLPPAAAHALGA